MAAVTSSSPAYTNGQTNALSLTTAGALRVDASAVTQPVSAASLPLPSGAATAANQISAQGATGSAAPSNASYAGARAQNAEPTPASNGSLTGLAVGLEGKLITLPYANKENMVRGSASQTGASATTFIAAQGSGSRSTSPTCSARTAARPPHRQFQRYRDDRFRDRPDRADHVRR